MGLFCQFLSLPCIQLSAKGASNSLNKITETRMLQRNYQAIHHPSFSFLAMLPRLLKCYILCGSTFHRAPAPQQAQDLQLAASRQGSAGVFPLQSKEGVSRREGFPGCPLDQLRIQGMRHMQTACAMTLHIREESPSLMVLQLNA